jgi:hypothetical protein
MIADSADTLLSLALLFLVLIILVWPLRVWLFSILPFPVKNVLAFFAFAAVGVYTAVMWRREEGGKSGAQESPAGSS